jgi:hypothetical protein
MGPEWHNADHIVGHHAATAESRSSINRDENVGLGPGAAARWAGRHMGTAGQAEGGAADQACQFYCRC